MADLVLHTLEWVPELPRGYVRDIRVRWALEEARLPYEVATVPFQDQSADHLAHQPFGQVPWLTDGDVSIFESGAILLYLGERSEALLPREPHRRAQAIEWLFAALNSVEMATLPQNFLEFCKDRGTPGRKFFDDFASKRLDRMEKVLSDREWIAGGAFSAADILMADVLRLVDRSDGLSKHPACRAYLERAKARPAFVKAYDDQMAHFAAADRKRAQG